MKPLVFDKNSWHYKIANYKRDTWWDGAIEDKYGDICSYSRLVLFKLSIIAFLCTAAFGAIFSVYDAAVYFVIGWIFGAGPYYYEAYPIFVWAGIIILYLVGIIISALIILALMGKLFPIIGGLILIPIEALSKSKPSFISEAYKAFKEKTCVRIKFEANHEDKD